MYESEVEAAMVSSFATFILEWCIACFRRSCIAVEAKIFQVRAYLKVPDECKEAICLLERDILFKTFLTNLHVVCI